MTASGAVHHELRKSPASYEAAIGTVRDSDGVRIGVAVVRAKAAEFRQAFGDERSARLLEWAADQVEGAVSRTDNELLTLAEAARRSGFSTGHLARLVRQGRIPDRRPPGSKGRLYIRAADLGARPPKLHAKNAGVRELASRLFAGGESPGGRA